jgi:hypothetical protein
LATPGRRSTAKLDRGRQELVAAQDFNEAGRRSRDDPALRLAGEGAAAVAIQLAGVKQKYAGRALTPDDLQIALQQAQTIARDNSASTRAIGRQLRAAHAERAQVTTTDLVAPLREAYAEVDRMLAEADTAFLRYQDVRQVLSDFLGVRLPGQSPL